jgi:hypothetical protein
MVYTKTINENMIINFEAEGDVTKQIMIEKKKKVQHIRNGTV